MASWRMSNFGQFQLATRTTPTGVPRASRLCGLAAGDQTGLLAEQIDLLAPHPVVQDHAHEAHGLPGHGTDGSGTRQPAEDLHLRLSS